MKCRLGEILKERGIKQIWLAEQVGANKTTITRLINGEAIPRLDTAYSIARVLGMDIKQIWIDE